MKFRKCEFKDIKGLVSQYYSENNIIIDSSFESKILNSNFYLIEIDEEYAGYFSIHDGNYISMFNLDNKYKKYSYEAFNLIKRYEKVVGALVPSNDQFFLNNCLDSFSSIEKQSFISRYEKQYKIEKEFEFELIFDENQIIEGKDFFDFKAINRINSGDQTYKAYTITKNESFIGYGVIEYSKVIDNVASIETYVSEFEREKSYGIKILKNLNYLVSKEGQTPCSSSWYYNHNSKKSILAAGGIHIATLLKITF